MQPSILLLSFQALIALYNVNCLVFHQRSTCGARKHFEMTFTARHPEEPYHALETFVFKTEVRPSGDKAQLLIDIDTMLSSYGMVGNSAEIAAAVHSHYDAYLISLTSSGGTEDNCPKASVADLGFEQHKASKQSLSSTAAPVNSNDVQYASEVLTVVSGYWNVKMNKHSSSKQNNPYEKWMQNTLRLRMPYVIFTDEAHVELIQQCRADLPTLLVLRNQAEFVTAKSYGASWTHPEHVPSAALANIWLEKINLLLLASQLTNTTYYAWVDAGLSTYRHSSFPPEEWSLDVLLSLPSKRISYAQVSGSYHSFAAGVMILHRELIPVLHELFYQEYNHCTHTTADWHCGSEQYLLTLIRDRLPHLFHPMSYDYGDISFLWPNRYPIVVRR